MSDPKAILDVVCSVNLGKIKGNDIYLITLT